MSVGVMLAPAMSISALAMLLAMLPAAKLATTLSICMPAAR
jgi:hypothetical protein